MNKQDYPALYQAADSAARKIQARLFSCLAAFLLLSVVGSALAVIGVGSKGTAIAAALVFMMGLAISIYMGVAKLENNWYRARAVAESVKTATWRFQACADPFGPELYNEAAVAVLRDRLAAILGEHKDLAGEFGGTLANRDQVTQAMVERRRLPLPDRVNFYREHRIKEQRAWYSTKSEFNHTRAGAWFAVFVGLQSLAILVLLLRIAFPEFRYWPVTVFAAAAGAVLTWTQTKRFRELAAVYGLTAHEIGLAEAGLRVGNDEEFSRSVDNTENAFSREHTQWIARKSK